MKYIFLAILTVHGLIHVTGFAKSFGIGGGQITKEISKPEGTVWLITAVLFIISSQFFIFNKENWFYPALIAVLLSQVLIITVWHDARYGTVVNLLIAVTAIFSWTSLQFEQRFKQAVKENLARTASLSERLITEKDLEPLPFPIQRYLRYAGVINRPAVNSFRVVFTGQMREKGKAYFPFRSVQYNFLDEPARQFFMKGRMFGMDVPGYHQYSNERARMDIKLFGILPLVHKAGNVMNKTETVTFFNEMCLLAPASLTDSRIEWQPIDKGSAKAFFTNKSIRISAIIYVNERGQLTNFTSQDRTDIKDMKEYLFSTPVTEYKTIGGINLMHSGEAVWHYADGPFTYGKFNLEEIAYNVQQ